MKHKLFSNLLSCVYVEKYYHGCQCHGVHSFECSSMICNELVFNS
jgi:hypothetical protein